MNLKVLRGNILKKLLLLFVITMSLHSDPIRVTFVNPGGIDDPFFSRLCGVMEAAAEDLNISLEILYSGRDYLHGLDVGNNVFSRKQQPDFLLLINENGMAERLVARADSMGVKTVLFNEGFSESYRKNIGDPVEVFKNCIAEILPDDSLAGYLLAKELITAKQKDKPEGKISVLGISGSPRNTSSQKRVAGLKQAISEFKNVTLLQTAPAHWEEEKAEKIAKRAYLRYPEIDVIWVASDKMAEGVLRSMKKAGKKSLIGGIDWATFAFDRVESGDFEATVGGHFFDGAWALVLISDYISHGKLKKKKYMSNSFDVINKKTVKELLPILKTDEWRAIDFTKHTQDNSGNYDFSLQKIWESLNVAKQ